MTTTRCRRWLATWAMNGSFSFGQLVRATSPQVLVGPYGVLLAAFAQVTVGFVQLRRRDEAQSRVPSSPPIGGSPSGDQEHDDAEVHPDECRACSRFDWWMPESQS